MALARKSYQNNSITGAELVWPANLLDSFDHLEIGIAKFVPRTFRSSESSSVGENKSVPVPSSTSLNTILPSSQFGGRVRSITQYTIKTGSTIYVPIPESVNYTDNPQWGNASGLTRFTIRISCPSCASSSARPGEERARSPSLK